MSAFLTPLDVRIVGLTSGRITYELLAPFRFRSDVLDDVIEVPAGFVTDAESIPTVIDGLSGPPCPWAGVIHDWLYFSHEVPKTMADSIYREALVTKGIDPIYADQRYAAVDFYGGTAWEDRPRKVVPA